MQNWIYVLSLVMVAVGCTAQTGGRMTHERLHSTLWMQTSPEYAACCWTVYSQATEELQAKLDDKSWTACLEQGEDYEAKPPAVILDVDETVLDNTPFEARLIRQNAEFHPDIWWPWCREAKAPPVPGVKEFLEYAVELGVEIVYLTNRSHEIENATRENIINEGLPFNPDGDHLLTKNEREEWGSDKGSRRAFAAKQYRIVMLFGDNLNDFVSGTRVGFEERRVLWSEHKEKWGKSWFMLPNPDYGDWERALWDWKRIESDAERLQAKYDALESMED